MTDAAGETLLVDWRTPLAAPFFAATRRDPMGLVSRRRYRWTHGRITDYWDEVFVDDPAVLTSHAALDEQSAFLADLGASRSPRMRDVLGTIATDQDAIIRADSHGTLVVDGGPRVAVAAHPPVRAPAAADAGNIVELLFLVQPNGRADRAHDAVGGCTVGF